ncbi:MAG TPA: glutathione peroxidase [Polyangiaceae bacterium]|nr:glutathione peroxidase [Polyangiaceae bacterium]
MKNVEGTKVPSVTFRTRRDGDWLDVDSDTLFKGKRVVLFALPGAYTPTCSSNHLPRYETLTPVLKENGVSDVYCLSVNDAFVMEAWAKDQGLHHVQVIPDGNGEFVEGLGFLVDKSDLGFGKRSWRFSMLVDDGVIEKMFIEEQKPGDPFEVSDADTMLRYLNPDAKLPPAVTIFSKPGCPFCLRAKALLREHGLSYEEILLGDGVSYTTLRNVTGRHTAPQIYIDGQHIDGLDGLEAYFEGVS